jgi:SAM-dependent methyltransferase
MTHSNSPFNEPAGLQGSYLNTNMGLAGTLSEFRNLFRIWRPHNIPTLIRRNLEEARAREVEINALLGAPVAGLKLLEIGPGQQLVQLAYFGTKNEVVGIDLDVIMHRLNLRDCLRILKQNGWLRTCKTVGRKLARIDTLVRKEVALQLGLQTTPDLRVLQMDATKMSFPDNQFDVVFSRCAFEHLSNPAAVVSEIRRVLKAGGVMSIVLHLFTCDGGCHDTRIFAGQRGDLPYWAHLQPDQEHKIRPNSYVNGLRLADWVRIFESEMPGCKVELLRDTSELFRLELSKLRSQGKLMDYSDDELFTYGVQATWRKPLLSGSRAVRHVA